MFQQLHSMFECLTPLSFYPLLGHSERIQRNSGLRNELTVTAYMPVRWHTDRHGQQGSAVNQK